MRCELLLARGRYKMVYPCFEGLSTLSLSCGAKELKEVSVGTISRRHRSFDSVLFVYYKSFKEFSFLSLTFTLVSCSYPLVSYCSMKIYYSHHILAIGFSPFIVACGSLSSLPKQNH